jgi:hypothetical protein
LRSKQSFCESRTFPDGLLKAAPSAASDRRSETNRLDRVDNEIGQVVGWHTPAQVGRLQSRGISRSRFTKRVTLLVKEQFAGQCLCDDAKSPHPRENAGGIFF